MDQRPFPPATDITVIVDNEAVGLPVGVKLNGQEMLLPESARLEFDPIFRSAWITARLSFVVSSISTEVRA